MTTTEGRINPSEEEKTRNRMKIKLVKELAKLDLALKSLEIRRKFDSLQLEDIH